MLVFSYYLYYYKILEHELVLNKVLEMPKSIDLEMVAPAVVGFTFPHWAVFLVVLVGIPILLLMIWLGYSYHKGSLCRGGEAGVTRKVHVEVNELVGERITKNEAIKFKLIYFYFI